VRIPGIWTAPARTLLFKGRKWLGIDPGTLAGRAQVDADRTVTPTPEE